IAAGMATDAAGNRNTASTSTDNTGTLDTTPPTVTTNQAAGQADPTSASPINFTAVFSEPVSGFTGTDVTIGGTAGGTKTVTVSGGPSTYTVAVSGMSSAGTVIATIAAGMATDAAGNLNTASTSTDNSVSFTPPDTTPPTVTINQAAGQADPTNAAPINFTAVFSEPVSGFTGTDVTIGGTAGGTKTVTVSGGQIGRAAGRESVSSAGTVIATIAAGMATDAAGNGNTASTSTDNSVNFENPPTTAAAGNLNTASTSTDNSVSFTPPDTTPPTVTINQATGQPDPTSAPPINFTAVFSEPVSGFTGTDVTIGGTAGGTKTVTVSGGPSKIGRAACRESADGTVMADIAAGERHEEER